MGLMKRDTNELSAPSRGPSISCNKRVKQHLCARTAENRPIHKAFEYYCTGCCCGKCLHN